MITKTHLVLNMHSFAGSHLFRKGVLFCFSFLNQIVNYLLIILQEGKTEQIILQLLSSIACII